MSGEILEQIPVDLRTNEAFTGMNTAEDLAKGLIDHKAKIQEFEGKVGDLEKRLGDSIPKLSENATDEEKGAFYKALGVPEKPEEYEFSYPEGMSPDKMLPEQKVLRERIVKFAQKMFHTNHATKEQAAGMIKDFREFYVTLGKGENIQRATGEDLSPHGAQSGGTKESDWYPNTKF